MNLANKFVATIIGLFIFVFPLVVQMYVSDLFGFIFFGQTIWSYSFILALFSLDIGFQSTLISVLIHSVFSVIVCCIYFKKLKKDKLTNVFRILFLLAFYFVQFFMIHQMSFGIVSLIYCNEIDANDFMGVVSFGFYSSFLFVVFGVIIDYIKNTNGLPKIKLY